MTFETKEKAMRELLVDFITSLDGYASAEGWPGWWGLQGSEYLAWVGEQPEVTYLMGANTYRLMSGFAAGEPQQDRKSSPPTRRSQSMSSRGRRRWCSLRRLRHRSRGSTPRSCAMTRSKPFGR